MSKHSSPLSKGPGQARSIKVRQPCVRDNRDRQSRACVCSVSASHTFSPDPAQRYPMTRVPKPGATGTARFMGSWRTSFDLYFVVSSWPRQACIMYIVAAVHDKTGCASTAPSIHPSMQPSFSHVQLLFPSSRARHHLALPWLIRHSQVSASPICGWWLRAVSEPRNLNLIKVGG